jgi:hypothetical protein
MQGKIMNKDFENIKKICEEVYLSVTDIIKDKVVNHELSLPLETNGNPSLKEAKKNYLVNFNKFNNKRFTLQTLAAKYWIILLFVCCKLLKDTIFNKTSGWVALFLATALPTLIITLYYQKIFNSAPFQYKYPGTLFLNNEQKKLFELENRMTNATTQAGRRNPRNPLRFFYCE